MVDKQRVGKIKGSREMLVTVISSFVLMSGIFIPIVESGINTVGPLDFCEGKQGVIPWNYTVDNLFSATWLKGSDTLMVFAFGLLTITPGKDVELDSSVSNGALKLLTVDANSGGLYTCTVIYDVEPAVNDIVNVSVITDQPGEPTHTKVDKTITCGSNSTTTMVTKRIKIDGVLSSAESASVEDKNTVECCFIGSEAKCADGNLDKTVLYCKVVQTGECKKCCRRVICYVGVLVNIPLAIAILILYCIIICFKKRILEKIGSIAFCCIIILPALCSMALGIGLAVGLCVGNCKECAETECAETECGECDDDSYLVLDTVLGAVLVIICNPCCSVGIILIHWKCFRGKTPTDCNKDNHDAGSKMQSKDAGNKHVNAGGQETSDLLGKIC